MSSQDASVESTQRSVRAGSILSAFCGVVSLTFALTLVLNIDVFVGMFSASTRGVLWIAIFGVAVLISLSFGIVVGRHLSDEGIGLDKRQRVRAGVLCMTGVVLSTASCGMFVWAMQV